MTMSMVGAFDAQMMTAMQLLSVTEGSYDNNNDWVEGAEVASTIYGVLTSGNRFSQFDEGIALHSEDGGQRYSDFKSLYIKETFAVGLNDLIVFKNVKYKILQQSDESIFGFDSFLLEKVEDQ